MSLQIILSNGMSCLVSECDYAVLATWKWTASPSKKPRQRVANWYAARWEKREGKRTKIYMHRFVANTPKGLVTNHINGNTLDNRRENLENCTFKENLEHSLAMDVDRSDEWA